jgi:hypothetical protein
MILSDQSKINLETMDLPSDFEHDVACIGKRTNYKNIDIIYHHTKCSFFANAPVHILTNWYQTYPGQSKRHRLRSENGW